MSPQQRSMIKAAAVDGEIAPDENEEILKPPVWECQIRLLENGNFFCRNQSMDVHAGITLSSS